MVGLGGRGGCVCSISMFQLTRKKSWCEVFKGHGGGRGWVGAGCIVHLHVSIQIHKN